MVEAQVAIQEKRPVYGIFLESIALSKILGHVLLSMYSPKTEYSARRDDFLILTIDNQLAQWKANLPPNLHFNPDEVSEMTLFSTGKMPCFVSDLVANITSHIQPTWISTTMAYFYYFIDLLSPMMNQQIPFWRLEHWPSALLQLLILWIQSKWLKHHECLGWHGVLLRSKYRNLLWFKSL